MKSFTRILFTLAAAVALGQSALAAQLGDAAAPLQITEWVKGKPVDLSAAKGKQVVVVEFWATWCAPCRQSIPHLTELQKKFKDVIFIGISNEDPDTVKKFVARMGDQMDYTVAVDKDDKTGEGYMKAFNIDGIPHAFIVDKNSKIVWQGHPMDNMDKVLADLQAGKYDMEKAKQHAALQSKVEEYVALAGEDEKNPKLEGLAKEIAALEKVAGPASEEGPFDPAEVRKMVHFQKALMAYQKAMAAGASPAELDKIGQELAATGPKDFKLAEFKEAMQARVAFNEYYRAATGGADKDTLAGLTKKINDLNIKNARLLNGMAWAILTDEKIQHRDYALAVKLSKGAVDATEGKEPAVLDTYARALFDSGNASEAVVWEKKAIAATPDDSARQELEASLKKYQAKAGK